MKTSSLVAAILVVGACARAQADWNSTITASNPLNWYRFNELSGSVAVDYGSQHLDGTYGAGALDAIRGVQGIVGTAAQFGNQSTAILQGSDITGNWSAEFVLDRLGSKTSSVLIRGVPFAFPSTALKLEQFSNTEQLGFTNYGVNDLTFSPAVPTPLNQWMDVVYVNRVGSGLSLYLNGVLAGTSSQTLTLSRYQIGSNADTVPESPLAIMDEAVIYNRALSAAEIAAHASAVPEPSTLVLAALAPCIMLVCRRRRA